MTEISLWDKDREADFFKKTLEVAPPEKLFYTTSDDRYLAYWPKNYNGAKSTLQSRNAFIGGYTEKWTREILEPIAKEINAYRAHLPAPQPPGEAGCLPKIPYCVIYMSTYWYSQKTHIPGKTIKMRKPQ